MQKLYLNVFLKVGTYFPEETFFFQIFSGFFPKIPFLTYTWQNILDICRPISEFVEMESCKT